MTNKTPLNRIATALVWVSMVALYAPPPAHAAESPPLWQTLPQTPALPTPSTTQTIVASGARLWVAEWGPRSNRPPVLLLHGGKGNSNYYGALIPVLVAHGFHVIAIDSRGHGHSTRTDQPLTYHLMADDVLSVLDDLQVERVSLVGWSDGGIIGIDLAIHHPERLSRLFAFGANVNPAGTRDDVDQSALFNEYLLRVRAEYARLSPTPERWEDFSAAVDSMWSSLPNYSDAELRTIHVPTTIADGGHDEAIRPEHVEAMAALIPRARLVWLPDLSHFAMLQDPRAFAAAVLEFLDSR